jgi:hypothetical protein
MKANSFYRLLHHLLDQVAGPRRRRERFSDGDVAFVLLWAEHHRRPVSWGCRRSSYPPAARFTPPSPTTMTRRGNGERVLQLIESARQRLAAQAPASPLKLIDSRPLIIGNGSGDPDARRGRAESCGRGRSIRSTATIRSWPGG